MILNKRALSLVKMGEILRDNSESLEQVIAQTGAHNPWFTDFHCRLMLKSFTEHFFDKQKVEQWINRYDTFPENNKVIGLVLAGNVPFVGMHDLLCVIVSGNRAMVKMSSKDQYFFPWLFHKLAESDPFFSDVFTTVERLENFDAVIATGSNNSARYFEYYFGKYPHIIRRNRTSVAILTGDESEDELHDLGTDIFYYYGLGCRNVSKIFIPKDFEPEKLFRIWEDFRYVGDHSKYKNNYDYNRTLLLLNQTPHLANDFFMMVETEKLFSPLATVFYEYYTGNEELEQKINAITGDLQCVVARAQGNTKFGQTQFPQLWDYADHVDTVQFLNSL